MVVGFNHNFRYKGEIYHIQTEDGGIKNPNIVTLLYRGGTILASKKMSYADIIKFHNLEQVVEELMKEQHKDMLHSLKASELDEAIARYEASRNNPPETASKPLSPRSSPMASEARTSSAQKLSADDRPSAPSGSTDVEASLEDIIFNDLLEDEK